MKLTCPPLRADDGSVLLSALLGAALRYRRQSLEPKRNVVEKEEKGLGRLLPQALPSQTPCSIFSTRFWVSMGALRASAKPILPIDTQNRANTLVEQLQCKQSVALNCSQAFFAALKPTQYLARKADFPFNRSPHSDIDQGTNLTYL